MFHITEVVRLTLDSWIGLRVSKVDKKKAIHLGIPIAKVCRNAIRISISQREKAGVLVNPIENQREAVSIFNRLMPVWSQVLTEPFMQELIINPDRLFLLRARLPEIPEKYLIDYSRFITGGETSDYVLMEYLDSALPAYNPQKAKIMEAL